MESMLTVRLESEIKEKATLILRSEGYSPSAAVRELFEYVAKNQTLPFAKKRNVSQAEIKHRLAALERMQISDLSTISDTEVKDMRMKERYEAHD